MNKKDKLMTVITLVLVLVLLSKSLFLDEVRPRNIDEQRFKEFVEIKIEEGKEDLGLLSRTSLSNFKVVAIQKLSDEGESEILYYDPVQGQHVQGKISGQYKAKVRGYFLYVIPYKEFSVEAGTK